MRILVIEDELLVAQYICYHLRRSFSPEVSLARNVEEARDKTKELLPHLILCDINLNNAVDGIDLIADLKDRYHFEVVFVTSYHVPDMIDRAIEQDPVHYLIKPFTEEQFYATIKLAIQKIEGNPRSGTARTDLTELLTKMEYEILTAIVKNKTTKQIADEFFVSPSTVKNHRHNICRKLGLESGNNAIIKWVMEHNLMSELL